MIAPTCPLPLQDSECSDVDGYIDELLDFVSNTRVPDSRLLQLLIGGVHILDFFARSPDLYASVILDSWRAWFDQFDDVQPIIDFLLRDPVDSWLAKPQPPPQDLVDFVSKIRRLSLRRDFTPRQPVSGAVATDDFGTIARHVAVGMKTKKIHEVDHFARYVSALTEDVASSGSRAITHLVDFGSGQNYLGRTLASSPYSKHVIAVEGRPHNIEGARAMDVHAKLAPKSGVHVNKKEFRALQESLGQAARSNRLQGPAALSDIERDLSLRKWTDNTLPEHTVRAKLQISSDGNGSIQYVQHKLEDGNLAAVVDEIADEPTAQATASRPTTTQRAEEVVTTRYVDSKTPNLMAISLHSCGNLSHHGLRSLVLNPAVSAVAVIGCCYNLCGERLRPPTYKLPSLRPAPSAGNEATHTSDPHGFPMSDRVCQHPTPEGTGIQFNITARMMAVQAPHNWGLARDEDFFTRHFYRALLQRIFVDTGVVEASDRSRCGFDLGGYTLGGALGGSTQPIIIGSLRKSCYADFVGYVRGAVDKLRKDPARGAFYASKMDPLTDADIRRYADEYAPRKKELCIVWSLMAFSATLVEAVMVVDRWCWLREQEEVAECWVEPVFDYAKSPRNLVVVGIKK